MLARIVYNGRVFSSKPPTFFRPATAINGLSKAYLSFSLIVKIENMSKTSLRLALDWPGGRPEKFRAPVPLILLRK